MVTSTLSHTMQVLDFPGLEISGLDLIHGCEMLLSGVGVEANLDKCTLFEFSSSPEGLDRLSLSKIPKQTVRAMDGVPLAIE